MTELDGTLSELARLRSGSEPIVSLYLDVRWGDEHQRERVRLFAQEKIRKTLAHYLPGSPGHGGLERTLQRVEEYVNGLAGQAYEAEKNGLALFGCESLGLWRTYYFRRSFKNELCADGIPHLAQLARLADDLEPAIVVVPSQAGADIYQVKLGDLAIEASLRGFVPRRDKDTFNPGTGGRPGRQYEREAKDERHQEAYVQRNRRAAATEVEALFDRSPGSHVVLVGTAECVAAFERELADRVRGRVIARIPRPRDWESGNGSRRDGVVAGAAAAVLEHERRGEERAVDAVVGQSLRGGLAVLGPDDVVQALNQGRVHRLVIEEDFARSGWLCDNCNALGQNAEAAEVCPYCGGALRAVQFLGEAMVARALAEGGEVELVAHTNKLHSYRGVGAFLRQTSASGLRGGNRWQAAPGTGQ
jgi:peptide subunit release factor 1 (eRF1)